MKRVIVIFVMIGILLGGAGCTVKADTSDPLKVAIVANGSIGDRGFTDMAYEGIQKAAEDFNIEYKVFECQNDPNKRNTALKAAASQYKLIFVDPGYFFEKPLEEVTEQFPDRVFVYIDGISDLEEVVSIPFQQNEGAFLAGCLAASLTDKTSLELINEELKVGFVGGAEMPVIKDYQVGFEQGVKYMNSDISVMAKYAGDHYDPARGKETARSVHEKGADIIFQAAGPTGLGVMQAADEEGYYAIGVDKDQGYLSPGYVASSMIKDVGLAVYETVERMTKNHLKEGKVYSYGVENDGVHLVYNEQTMDIIPASTYFELKKIRKKISKGEIEVRSHFD